MVIEDDQNKLLVFKVEMKHPRKIAAAVNFSACQHYQLCAIVTGFFTFHVTEHVRCFKNSLVV